MVNILFDHQIFSMQRFGGISRYFANIYGSIKNQPDIHADIAILRTNNHYIQDFPAPLNNTLGDVLIHSRDKAAKWNKAYSKFRIKKNDYNLLHPTYYDSYFLNYTKKPYVITVHDMIHEMYQEFFDPNDKFVRHKRICVENAAHIIAISDSTKQDLISILGVEESRISVIHHGYIPNPVQSPKQTLSSVKKDYFLFVGDRRGYKNFSRFITGIAPVLRKNNILKLICAGGGPFENAEEELFFRLKISNQVSQKSVSDLELTNLYSNAIAFIYPSLYEGFGLPILEAFENACPAIVSDNKCFREIGRDAVLYFDPYSSDELTIAVEALLNDETLRTDFMIRGKKLLPEFSMDNCMEKTLAVYKDLTKQAL